MLLFVVLLISVIAIGCSSSDVSKSSKFDNKLDEIKDRDKIVVGIKYDAPLLGYKNPSTNEVEGMEIDIAKELAKDIFGDEKQIELKEVTAKTRVEMLKNNDVDLVIATMQITEERKKEIDFSDPYFLAGQTLLVPIDSPINTVEDIDSKDKTIVLVKGSNAERIIRENDWEVEVKEYENLGETFTALRNGKGDAFMNHNSIQAGMIEQSLEDGEPTFKIVGPPITHDEVGMGFKKGDEDLVKYVNDFLAKISEDGTLKEIQNRWLPDLED